MSKKRAGYVYLNDVPTRILTWGKWIDEPFTEGSNKELILCIPGNPGVTAFYDVFLQTLYDKVRIPVWIIGHSGHEKPNSEDFSIPDVTIHKNKFNLESQINNKVLFIERYIPKDVKIYLLGHSVGSYTILHLLEHPSIKQRIIKNYFLFPTIERLSDSVNGIIMISLVKPIVPIILFLSWIFKILPRLLQLLLVYIFCKIASVQTYQIDAIVKFVDPYVLTNIFVLAYDQLRTIKERPSDKLEKNLDDIKMYYGRIDNWVPPLVPISIKNDIPQLDVEICERGIWHSFVLYQSKEMGEIVADWLSEHWVN